VAFDKTQKTNTLWNFAQGRRVTFAVKAAKVTEKYPGVGQYQAVETGFKKLSTPPAVCRRMR